MTSARLLRVPEPALLLAFFWLLYAAASSGDMMADWEIGWATAQQLVAAGWFDIPPSLTPQHAVGIDGKAYSFYASGQAILLTPCAALGRLIALLPLPLPGSADLYGEF